MLIDAQVKANVESHERMCAVFVIEDELHCEWSGEFATLDAALAELKRRANLPWDEAPNQAPCTSWRTCGRQYQVIEFDAALSPWKELRCFAVLEVSAAGAKWSAGFGE